MRKTTNANTPKLKRTKTTTARDVAAEFLPPSLPSAADVIDVFAPTREEHGLSVLCRFDAADECEQDVRVTHFWNPDFYDPAHQADGAVQYARELIGLADPQPVQSARGREVPNLVVLDEETIESRTVARMDLVTQLRTFVTVCADAFRRAVELHKLGVITDEEVLLANEQLHRARSVLRKLNPGHGAPLNPDGGASGVSEFAAVDLVVKATGDSPTKAVGKIYDDKSPSRRADKIRNQRTRDTKRRAARD